MKRTWILAASAAQARCFERKGTSGPLELLRSFECPLARSKGVDLVTDRSGYEAMGPGRGSASFGHRVGPREKVREEFARDLARFLSAAIAARRCSELVVLAPRPLLGRIKAHLSQAACRALTAAIGKDLMGLEVPALLQRVRTQIPHAALQ